jgi:hypothetical protein
LSGAKETLPAGRAVGVAGPASGGALAYAGPPRANSAAVAVRTAAPRSRRRSVLKGCITTPPRFAISMADAATRDASDLTQQGPMPRSNLLNEGVVDTLVLLGECRSQ